MQVWKHLTSGQRGPSPRAANQTLSPRHLHPLASDERAGTGEPSVALGGDWPKVPSGSTLERPHPYSLQGLVHHHFPLFCLLTAPLAVSSLLYLGWLGRFLLLGTPAL